MRERKRLRPFKRIPILFALLLYPAVLICEPSNTSTQSTMSLQNFLNTFLPRIQEKSKQSNRATWILETTGSKDAATLSAELATELRLLFHDRDAFEKLLAWEKDTSISDPLVKRTINVLLRSFKPNLVPQELLEKISHDESNLALLYSNFRPVIDGKPLSENEILEILKKETNIEVRKKVWEASKEIGKTLAPHILSLVKLRNTSAKTLGYQDYFSMQLELQEVHEEGLFKLLDDLAKSSDSAYARLIESIHKQSAKRFGVPLEMVGPWAWSDPFCQEDPLDTKELDSLIQNVDLIATAKQLYQNMKLPVETILERSDNFERPGKNQHAFCINIDREGDVRTLNNIKPTIRWLETLFHELGHGVYELSYSSDLPWILKEPPHMITTEAMALYAGRQAYRTNTLKALHIGINDPSLREKAEMSLKRRQLIFSRWVLVMTYFERELYRNPDQDLNRLWWSLVERFQKIKCSGSVSGCDWAAKYHIGLAPVYYYSYLLGELFASSIEKTMDALSCDERGKFLKEKLFAPGDSLSWDVLIKQFTGKPLDANDWLSQFASKERGPFNE